MHRWLLALLVALALPPVMAGCRTVTEPAFDDEFEAWAGTWVGADARFQITLKITRGIAFRTCIGSCSEYSGLYATASLSDVQTGYSGTGKSTVDTQSLFGSAAEIGVVLLDREVTDTPGIRRIVYTYRGALERPQQTTGTITVMRFDPKSGVAGPISTDTYPVTLRKQ